MKVIIAGSRKITSYKEVKKAIKESGFEITEIVSGCAKGVDELGEKYANSNRIEIKEFPAKWGDLMVTGAVIKENEFGKYNCLAGFQRNVAMGVYADALIAIWDGKSKGTMSMINIMNGKGKKVFIKKVK